MNYAAVFLIIVSAIVVALPATLWVCWQLARPRLHFAVTQATEEWQRWFSGMKGQPSRPLSPIEQVKVDLERLRTMRTEQERRDKAIEELLRRGEITLEERLLLSPSGYGYPAAIPIDPAAWARANGAH